MRSVAYKNGSSVYLCFLVMSPDPYFFFILVSEHNSTTTRNILMVLGRIIEQVNAECHIRNDNSTNLHFIIMSLIHILLFFLFWSATLQPLEVF